MTRLERAARVLLDKVLPINEDIDDIPWVAVPIEDLIALQRALDGTARVSSPLLREIVDAVAYHKG